MMCLIVLVVFFSIYLGITTYVITIWMMYAIGKLILTKNWKGLKGSLRYYLLLGVFLYFGINLLWLILGMITWQLYKHNMLKVVLTHPILTYEYIYRQMQQAWAILIINGTPNNASFEFVHDVKRYSLKRINEIEARGVKFEFLQNHYEKM